VLGSYVAYFAYVQFGIHPFISIVIAGVLLYALGYAVQAGIINRVLAAPVLITLTLTFGLERALDRASPVPSLIFWRGVPTISPNTTRRLALVASRSTARRDTLVVVGVFLAKLANLAVFDFLPPPALPGAPPFIPVQVSSHDLRLTAKPRQRALHVGPGGRYWTVAHAALRHCRIIVGHRFGLARYVRPFGGAGHSVPACCKGVGSRPYPADAASDRRHCGFGLVAVGGSATRRLSLAGVRLVRP
jgi:hypothetical protein